MGLSMTYSKNGKTYHCPVEAALEVIGGKWKPLILWAIGDDVLRFSELQKALPGINTKMLTKQLRCLEKDGVILRTVYPEVPPRVEYRITDFGKTLIPILKALCDWGADYLGINEYSADECKVLEAKQSSETAAAHPRSKLRGIRGAAA
jgi:DNA-binding HxlR family transcriptional regulator